MVHQGDPFLWPLFYVWAHLTQGGPIGKCIAVHKSFNAREIEQFRRQAKQRARASDTIKYQTALNLIAQGFGYKNWSLLMKHADAEVRPTPFQFTRTDEEMALAMRLVTEPRSRRVYETRSDYARSKVEDIQARFVSAENAVDFAISYMESALRALRFTAPSASLVNHEMRLWLPYCALAITAETSGPQILVNRQYKPVGDTTGLHAIYEQHAHLHLNVAQAELSVFSHRPDSKGFLYNDGSLPWRTRKNAEAYLGRLRLLRSVM